MLISSENDSIGSFIISAKDFVLATQNKVESGSIVLCKQNKLKKVLRLKNEIKRFKNQEKLIDIDIQIIVKQN